MAALPTDMSVVLGSAFFSWAASSIADDMDLRTVETWVNLDAP